jgi:hypothetical protein
MFAVWWGGIDVMSRYIGQGPLQTTSARSTSTTTSHPRTIHELPMTHLPNREPAEPNKPWTCSEPHCDLTGSFLEPSKPRNINIYIYIYTYIYIYI